MLTWRAMVAPIRATTGINTKLLVALELGVPLVVTPAAAAPLSLGSDGATTGPDASAKHNASRSASKAAARPALLADDAKSFTAATLKAVASADTWRVASRAASAAFARMLVQDPAASDVAKLLGAACVLPRKWHAGHSEWALAGQRHAIRMRGVHRCQVIDEAASCSGRS